MLEVQARALADGTTPTDVLARVGIKDGRGSADAEQRLREMLTA
jgi:hypothetical protein